jgi:membrane associated rhomboid family serine protease
MIPIKDSIKSRHFPKVNLTLIFISVAVFLYELLLDQYGLQQFTFKYGAVPAKIMATGGRVDALWPLVTAMFLHGGWLHLIGNMLFLWVFGDNVEDRFGSVRYLLFYFGAGCQPVFHRPDDWGQRGYCRSSGGLPDYVSQG